MTKVDDLETYILDGKEYLSTYSIRKLLAKVGHLGFTKYACEEVLKRFRIQTDTQTDQTPKQKIINKTNSANPPLEQNFIDDPVELLTSVCKRSLNKPNPDARWASILLTLLDKTNKLEYKDVEEAKLQNKLRTKSISELILSKKQLMKL